MKFKGKMQWMTGAALGRWALLWMVIFFLAGLSGCAHPISKGVMASVDKDRTFSVVIEDPEANVGSTVLWGGVIEKATDGPDGTELIVRQSRLDSKGYPQTDSSEGEFIVRTPRPLNPEVFLKGVKITVAGEIDDVTQKTLGPVRYPCPVVRAIEIHAWTKRWGSFPISRGWEFNQYSPSARRMAQ